MCSSAFENCMHGMAFYRSCRSLLSPGKAWANIVISAIPASDRSIFLLGLPLTSTMNPTCIVYLMKRLGVMRRLYATCHRCGVERDRNYIHGVRKNCYHIVRVICKTIEYSQQTPINSNIIML